MPQDDENLTEILELMYQHKRAPSEEKGAYWQQLRALIERRIDGQPLDFDDAYGYILHTHYRDFWRKRRQRDG